MYSSLAPFYDEIFPQEPRQLDFIEKIAPFKRGEKVLDIGCATGSLTDLLAQRVEPIGLDLDEALLAQARKNYPALSFQRGDMLCLQEAFGASSFHRVVSFGNTLVHLPHREALGSHLYQVQTILRPGGWFIAQIIHYDRILDQGIKGLPPIETPVLKFERDYQHREDQRVDFNTTLHLLETGETFVSSFPLLALRRSELEEALEGVGFENIRFYGDLEGSPLTRDSLALFLAASKLRKR